MKQPNENNLTIRGVMYESYKNDPNQHPKGKFFYSPIHLLMKKPSMILVQGIFKQNT